MHPTQPVHSRSLHNRYIPNQLSHQSYSLVADTMLLQQNVTLSVYAAHAEHTEAIIAGNKAVWGELCDTQQYGGAVVNR